MFNINTISDLSNVIAFICEWAFIKANSLKEDKERYKWLVGLEEEAQRNRPKEVDSEAKADSMTYFRAYLVGIITYTAIVRWVTENIEELALKEPSLKENPRSVIDELAILMAPIISSIATESDLLEGFGEFHYNYWYEHVGQFK